MDRFELSDLYIKETIWIRSHNYIKYICIMLEIL